jgi:hypothetical protein
MYLSLSLICFPLLCMGLVITVDCQCMLVRCEPVTELMYSCNLAVLKTVAFSCAVMYNLLLN